MHCNELEYRSNHRRCSVKKVVLRNFVKYKGKHLRLWQKCFPLNFAKFLGTSFLRNTSWRLLLVVYRTHYDSLKCTRSSCENCIQFKSIWFEYNFLQFSFVLLQKKPWNLRNYDANWAIKFVFRAWKRE